MLNTNSQLARILLQPKTRLNFYSTERLLLEIEEHSKKLKNISGYSEPEFKRIFEIFTRKIRFINVQLIPKEIYLRSLSLTENVDVDDTEFVALTEHIKGKLWSGDKELRKGLENKNWNKFISTTDLFEICRIKKM
jgi:predicted nucleic acid-binding protein